MSEKAFLWQVNWPSQSSVRPVIYKNSACESECRPGNDPELGQHQFPPSKRDLSVAFVRLFSDMNYTVTSARRMNSATQSCFLTCDLVGSQVCKPEIVLPVVTVVDTPMEIKDDSTISFCVKNVPCLIQFTVFDSGSADFPLNCEFFL